MSGGAGEFAQRPEQPRVWETIGAAVRLLWEHPVPLMIPVVFVQALIVTETIIIDEVRASDEDLRIDLALIQGLFEGLLGALGVAAVVVMAPALARDQATGPAEAFNAVFQRIPALFVLTAVGWALFLPLAFGVRETQDQLGLGLLLFVLVVPAIYVELRFAVAMPLLLLEGDGPIEALRRSWRIMNGYMLRLFGILVVEAIAGGAVAFGVVYALVATDIPEAVVTIVSHFVAIPIVVAGAVALTLYYLRIREAGAGSGPLATAPQGSPA